MAIQLVGNTTGYGWKNPAISYSSTAGNTLVVVGSLEDGSMAVTDNAGNQWLKLVSTLSKGASGQRAISVWVCFNASPTSAITVTGTGHVNAIISEWSGVGSIAATSAAYQAPAPVTVNADQLALAAVGWYESVPLGSDQQPNSPFVLIDGNDDLQGGAELWAAYTTQIGSVSGTWVNEKPSVGHAAIVLDPNPPQQTRLSVWDGTQEIASNVTVWDGTSEVPAAVDDT